MKITRLGPTRPVIGIGGLLGGGTGGGGGAGTVPTATGSNGGVSWSSNVGAITVNGAPVLGPYVNFADGSNTTVTVDQVASAASNTIRVHATGGAVSFGSNATRVSELSSVGAGSDAARTDHIHDGIGTITASSSNTMQRGTWNLRAGTGIALALTDTDGDGEFDTTTIVNTGQAGGGGSLTVADEGTPLATAATTLDFVGAGVTATGAGATKTITIPGGGSGGGNSDLLLDFPPSSPDADDDEFPGTSLSGSWTDPLTSASGQTNLIVVANGWMVLEPATSGSSSTGKHVFGIRKASPSGSFTVSVKFVDGYGLGDSRPGVFVGVSGGKAHVCGPGSQDLTPAMAIGVSTYSESADWSGYDGFLPTAPYGNIVRHMGWYRIRWDASASTLYFDHSFNGVLWYNFSNRTSQSQPTSMGVCLYSNSGVIEAHHRLAVNWFRVIDGSAAF